MLTQRTQKILARLDAAKRLLAEHGPMPPVELARLHEQMVLDWTYNSNALAGNTLTRKETKLVLQKEVAIGGKSLRDIQQVINHRAAIAYVEGLAANEGQIHEENIRAIQGILCPQGYGLADGYSRTSQGEKGKASPLSLPIDEVQERLAAFARHALGNAERHPVYQAALAHVQFVALQPFQEGNGRTARLLMNVLLLKNGYGPAIILKNDSQRYAAALQKAQGGLLDDFIFFMARVLERTLCLYLDALPGLTAGFVSLTEAALISPYSREYLNVMARRGTIPAFKLRRNWLIAPEALAAYGASKGWRSI